MARVPTVTRDQLKPEDRGYFDEVVESRGGLKGPYGVLLHVPKLAARVAATGSYVRFDGELPGDLKEVVILATAHEISSTYQFEAHTPLAIAAGVAKETVKLLASGAAPDGLPLTQVAAVHYTRQLLRDKAVDDATFGAAMDRLGLQGVLELTGLVGHYVLVGLVLAAFQVQRSDESDGR